LQNHARQLHIRTLPNKNVEITSTGRPASRTSQSDPQATAQSENCAPPPATTANAPSQKLPLRIQALYRFLYRAFQARFESVEAFRPVEAEYLLKGYRARPLRIYAVRVGDEAIQDLCSCRKVHLPEYPLPVHRQSNNCRRQSFSDKSPSSPHNQRSEAFRPRIRSPVPLRYLRLTRSDNRLAA